MSRGSPVYNYLLPLSIVVLDDLLADDNFNKHCEALLAQYIRKNTKTVTQRLEMLCGFLRQKGNVVQTTFGDPIRKGTYVTGLSRVL